SRRAREAGVLSRHLTAADGRGGSALVPAPSRRRCRRTALPDFPRPVPVEGPARRHRPRPRGPPPSGVVQRLDAHVLGARRPTRRRRRPPGGRRVPSAVGAADRVIAVSEATARELGDLLAVPERKIRVVPNAVEEVFTPEGPR